MIRVQTDDFDLAAELERLTDGNFKIGGVASFIGLVRDFHGDETIKALTLEHYAGMTERQLLEIESQALKRWPLAASLIIHRYGRLKPGDRIVFVATASAHRDAAFESCRFLVDWLKTMAPFWKAAETSKGHHWVEAVERDVKAADAWREAPSTQMPE